jgi:hypothetical protein
LAENDGVFLGAASRPRVRRVPGNLDGDGRSPDNASDALTKYGLTD